MILHIAGASADIGEDNMVGEKEECPYEDCSYTGTEKMLEIHERAKHIHQAKREDETPDKKRSRRRVEKKPPVFRESEPREEFRRKKGEFDAYVVRTGVKGRDQADDLYHAACDTPLRRKLQASSKISHPPEDTDPKVMMDEMERLCCPVVNVMVERQQFRLMRQEEDEAINSFEGRLRTKATVCEFKCCNCNKVCKVCEFNAEDEAIKEQILLGMNDKEEQVKLMAKTESIKALDIILDMIRSKESTMEQQSALAGQAGTYKQGKECHNCHKTGHFAASCPMKKTKKEVGKETSRGCGFCGATKMCKAKNCRAYNMKCNSCGKFGHLATCCTDWTQRQARDKPTAQATGTKGGAKQAEEDNQEEEETSRSVRIGHIKRKNPYNGPTVHNANSIVWCPSLKKFTRKRTPNHVPLKLEVETLHNIDMDVYGNDVKFAKEPIYAKDKRKAVDNTNCPDTGASITLAGRHIMRKLGVKVTNLHRDKTKVSAAEGTNIRVLGFLPVVLRVKDENGEVHEAWEIMYFAEGITSTLVSLNALKSLGSVPECFPRPETASSLTEGCNELSRGCDCASQHQTTQDKYSSHQQRQIYRS